MTTKDQIKTMVHVYKKLIGMESQGWSSLDDAMLSLNDLDNDQLCAEAYILLQEHKTKHIVPEFDVPNPNLLIPMIIESVATIINIYEESGITDDRCRYILEQYLSLHHVKKLKFHSKSSY